MWNDSSPVDDKFASTPNLTHTRVYKQYARSILTGGVWDNIPNWVDNDKQGIIFFEFFFWWVFGGASYVNALPLAQRQKCKNVPKGKSGTNLGWMVTETKVYARDYPVDFPGGKRAPAVLQIHETSDEIMKKVTAVDKKLLKMGHHLILDGLKDSKKNYKFASPP